MSAISPLVFEAPFGYLLKFLEVVPSVMELLICWSFDNHLYLGEASILGTKELKTSADSSSGWWCSTDAGSPNGFIVMGCRTTSRARCALSKWSPSIICWCNGSATANCSSTYGAVDGFN
jgi:hypothetical protein